MKIICNGNDLANASMQVSKAMGAKLAGPILEGIYLKASGKELTLIATDLELAIEKTIKANVLLEGETVVPGRFFVDFIKKLTHEQIELNLVDSRLKIRYADSEGFLQTMSATEFPPTKELSSAEKFTIEQKHLKDLVNKIVFSVATDDSRPILKGVLLEVGDDSLTGVALDGYRLAKCTKSIQKTSAMMQAIVPSRSITELSRILEDTDEPISVSVQKNYIMAQSGGTRITSRLLNGDFINYKQIIPTSFETKVVIPSEVFLDGLDRAMLLAKSEKSNLVKFTISSDTLSLESNSEIGRLNEKIPVKFDGVDLVIAFNARYFSDILRNTSCEHITIKLTSPSSPCVVVPSSESEDFLYLVLPVRITE